MTKRKLLHLLPLLLCLTGASVAQTSQPLSVAPDSPRWEIEGNGKVADYLGRKALRLDGAAAILKDFDMRDGVIDVDVATTAKHGFFGFDVRIDQSGENFEEIYLRPHQSGYPDAMQYTPVFNTGRNWQLYSGPGFTARLDIPRNEWFHMRLEMTGAHAKLFVKDMDKPALEMPDLKSGVQKGQIALMSLLGETFYSNFQVRITPDVPWQRNEPAMAAGTLTKWSISPDYDASQKNVERALTQAEIDSIEWQDVEAEAPGLVVLQRYRKAPHVPVTFQQDFSTRLQPQKGVRVLYAKTTITSERDQLKKLQIGYSDEVTVFLNGQPMFRGRSAQAFRDPRFLGIVDPEDDAVYLPLKQGNNELILAISELGGGWGFNCRLADIPQ